MVHRLLVLLVVTATLQAAPRWIWAAGAQDAPKNRFTWFRKVVELKTVPADATLLFAADSNAHLWINGQVLRRKVTRYHEDKITAEVVDASGALRRGRNAVVVLHHNWGPIVTFQRSANRHAGLWIGGAWLETDASWKARAAPEYLPHESQIVGANKGRDHRIRYPVIEDRRKALKGEIHSAAFDDADWPNAVEVLDGPWPASPAPVETPGQSEYAVDPAAAVAAGVLTPAEPLRKDPLSIAAGIRTARYTPREEVRSSWPVVRGRTGESRYITFDFHQPVHGYPFLELAGASEGVTIDFGYGELACSQYSGRRFIDTNGWLNPEAVVGAGYADRYITRAGAQSVELPDERTARWLTLHFHFASDGELRVSRAGMVRSQYPVEEVGTFACGNRRVEQIVRLCRIHAQVTMSDGYVDTPGREDGQWIEDARVRGLIASRWFGDERLRRVMLRIHAESTRGDGGFHAFPPSNYPAYPASYDWAAQWTAMLYDDYLWSGRTDLIKRYWSVLAAFWQNTLSRVDEQGIWRSRRVLADIRVGVHPSSDSQSSGIVTAFLIERLRWSAQMARASDHTAEADRWQRTADRMAQAFRRYHWIAATATVPAHADDCLDPEQPSAARGFSQAAQANTVLAGLVSDAEARAVLDYAFTAPDGSPPPGVTRWNNPTFSRRSLRALSDHGLAARAVAHLIERYSPYLPGNPRNRVDARLQGPHGGPLPEYWVSREDRKLKEGEINTAQPDDETGSHGWGAAPLLWLHDSLLGVRISEPGGGRLRIAPEAGGLPFVSGATRTPKGLVRVSWHPAEGRLEVRIPAGVTAELVIPTPWRDAKLRAPTAARASGVGRYRLQGAGSYVFSGPSGGRNLR